MGESGVGRPAGGSADGPSPRSGSLEVSVTVDDDHLQDVDAVAERLRAQGMQIDQVMGAIGIISGSVPAGMRRTMGEVPGVAAVDGPLTFRVAPPTSAIQ